MSLSIVPKRPQTHDMALHLLKLLQRVGRQDRAAFAELYEATSLKLFGVVMRILRQRAVAEDILQEVYIKIWDRASDFDASRGSPITWMTTVARNRALDEVRRGGRIIASDDVPGFDNIGSNEPSALDAMERSQEYQRLERCLHGLDVDKRKLVVLAYNWGLSRDDLAQRFSQPVSTIKTWLRRSLQSLKECLQS